MNPPSKHQSLFFTPRSPNGKRLQRQFQDHMRASEEESRLPREEKKGAVEGGIEVSGGPHGKLETKIKLGLNTNSNFAETAKHEDYLWEGREKLNRERAEAKWWKERERQRQEKAAQAAQQSKPPSQPSQSSRWKFKAPPASTQRVQGL